MKKKRVGGDWKRNLLRIPKSITEKINRSKNKDIVVACTRKVTLSDIQSGIFKHLGIEHDATNETVIVPKQPLVPPRAAGRYSERNVDGHEIVRKDLPMTTRTYEFETPNWGDWSNGSHSTEWSRKVYQREFEPPRGLTISVESLGKEDVAGETRIVFKFQIEAVLRRGMRGFEDELFYALNVLQENTGAVDVFAADATRDDYLKTVYVAWEILPPGERDATIAIIISRLKNPTEAVKARVVERYTVLSKLKPSAYVAGTSGFNRYFGAQFGEDFVVFENLEYGNAIYAFPGDWENLSQKSRLELLKGDTSKFIRIVHTSGWKETLKQVVEKFRTPKAA